MALHGKYWLTILHLNPVWPGGQVQMHINQARQHVLVLQIYLRCGCR